jgi:hypothetical protein
VIQEQTLREPLRAINLRDGAPWLEKNNYRDCFVY